MATAQPDGYYIFNPCKKDNLYKYWNGKLTERGFDRIHELHESGHSNQLIRKWFLDKINLQGVRRALKRDKWQPSGAGGGKQNREIVNLKAFLLRFYEEEYRKNSKCKRVDMPSFAEAKAKLAANGNT